MRGLTAVRSDVYGLPVAVAALLLVGLLATGCGGSAASGGGGGDEATLSGIEVEMHFDPG